eukprot:scaffold459_cov117-Isochrysis_galbana.AAC.17
MCGTDGLKQADSTRPARGLVLTAQEKRGRRVHAPAKTRRGRPGNAINGAARLWPCRMCHSREDASRARAPWPHLPSCPQRHRGRSWDPPR